MVRLVFAVIFLGMVTGCSAQSDPPQSARGQIELSDAFSGEFDLVDMNNERATPARFEGKPTLIYFGFTACPDICPTALGVMSATLNELGSKGNKIQPLFIALDPERDTPDVLASYLGFEPRILGLTGNAKQIEAAKEGFKVYSERQDLRGSALGYTIDHSSLFYFVDATGAPQYAYTDSLSPQQLAAFLRPLL